MDKKLLSTVIAAALAAPMAVMADTTIYGKLHVDAASVDSTSKAAGGSGASTTLADNMQVRSRASRVGIKGSEDLGGGLKANFQVEWGIDLADNSTISNRNHWVGMSGDSWGEFRVGRHDTPLKMAQGKFDQFNDTDGDIGGISQGETRANNVIAYISPNFNGLTVAAAGIAGEETGAGADDTGLTDSISIAAMYSNGPLFVSAAYDNYDADSASGALDTLWRLVATYKVTDDFMVGGLYEAGSDEGTGGDKDVYGLSAKYSMGNNAVKFQYLNGETEVSGASDTEQDEWSIGFDHYFSKRTSAYVMYNNQEQDAAAGGATADLEYDSISVGMVHKF